MDFSLKRNSMIISKKVVYTNLNNVLKADVIEINIENKDTILKGDRVFHQKFGYGLVINLENDNAEVNFEKTSTKKVKIDYLIKDV